MKNSKITKAYDSIEPSIEAENRVLSKILNSPKTKKRSENFMGKKITAIAAIAAVLAICIIGGSLSGVFHGGKAVANSFSIVAHAATDMEKDVNLTLNPANEGGEGMVFAMTRKIDLDVLGDNIKTVHFKSDKSNVRFITFNDDKKSPAITINGGESEYLFDYKANKNHTIALTYVGGKTMDTIPESTTITAIATFNDGTTKTQTLTVDLK